MTGLTGTGSGPSRDGMPLVTGSENVVEEDVTQEIGSEIRKQYGMFGLRNRISS